MSLKWYVTTPIYYVNARPHVGTLYSTVLADVSARWKRLMGIPVFFLTGTDEHGQKVAEAAEKAQKDPRAFVDTLVPDFVSVWKRYNISYDHFVRTTDESHVTAVQKWIQLLQERGDIYKSVYEGWYDQSQEAFLTDKDLEFRPGLPDQPISLLSGNVARRVSEECYFFRLSAYQGRLLHFYKEHPDFITPHERLQEVISFVESGLKDLSISRKGLTWGIPFPGDPEQVVYVWADALNNYLTAIGWGDEKRGDAWKSWWPADMQVMAKDIVRFHAVYWPAFLMALGLEMPKLLVHGWITVDGKKMSKSLGNVVDPMVLADKYAPDVVRYYLVRYLAVTQDANFSYADLEHRANTDLANDFGNLVNRLLVLAAKHSVIEVRGEIASDEAAERLKTFAAEMLAQFEQEMNRGYFHQAYAHVQRLVHAINSYFHEQEPWKLVAKNRDQFVAVLATTAHAIGYAATLLYPVMPQTIEKLFEAFGVLVGSENARQLLNGAWWEQPLTLRQIPPLFIKYEPAAQPAQPKETPVQSNEQKTSQPSEKTVITIDDLAKVELVVGTITHAEDVPNSEKIYRMTVDLGSCGVRTICAGVKQSFAVTDLIGKKTIFVANLPPRKLMGIESQGMMLVVPDAQGKQTLVSINEAVPNGTRLR